ncbi:RNA polymerase I upstream activation factor complex subunit Rrn5 [Schizosaccharomyces cryophilus OY26]|uniref:RNA polymerase I upstream activation factor complex subunit Rrn5 n=1 Tax=Schizosaccharomyces cryophilus (strain OY26 / ATCC MYA-4695 / CBS 11777 / NBRC 106824 / NRRL Y48691) TaxID=653667 RepID=S9WZT2_SCHCR|nr:RNA polymerase I upstream activation factor complex subunit Rrn5 [Schizosaccharomyces cryophilus OY26]EPY50232.1 RNA polymerase I upstream activation factor complex subunit Rrn5 [Schizosaccharomyces cryophilus OY26]
MSSPLKKLNHAVSHRRDFRKTRGRDEGRSLYVKQYERYLDVLQKYINEINRKDVVDSEEAEWGNLEGSFVGNTFWTTDEKHSFFEGLASKSPSHVQHYIDALDTELRWLKNHVDSSTRSRCLIKYEDIPASSEMSSEWVEWEEYCSQRLISALNKISSENEIKESSINLEANGRSESESLKPEVLFNVPMMEKLCSQFYYNEMSELDSEEKKPTYYTSLVLQELLNVVKQKTKELVLNSAFLAELRFGKLESSAVFHRNASIRYRDVELSARLSQFDRFNIPGFWKYLPFRQKLRVLKQNKRLKPQTFIEILSRDEEFIRHRQGRARLRKKHDLNMEEQLSSNSKDSSSVDWESVVPPTPPEASSDSVDDASANTESYTSMPDSTDSPAEEDEEDDINMYDRVQSRAHEKSLINYVISKETEPLSEECEQIALLELAVQRELTRKVSTSDDTVHDPSSSYPHSSHTVDEESDSDDDVQPICYYYKNPIPTESISEDVENLQKQYVGLISYDMDSLQERMDPHGLLAQPVSSWEYSFPSESDENSEEANAIPES